MKRRRFTSRVKESLLDQYNRECAGCSSSLVNRTFHWDHIIPLALGGDDTQDNLQPLCTACHKVKTGKKDIPAIAKAARLRTRHKGIKRQSAKPLPFGKGDYRMQKINGEVIRRPNRYERLRAAIENRKPMYQRELN